MNSEHIRSLKPFLSVLTVILTLLAVVFLQMEERRMGYLILKLGREHKAAQDERRSREIQLAKITRPQLLEHVAQNRFTLKKANADQIIHLSGEGGRSLAGKKEL